MMYVYTHHGLYSKTDSCPTIINVSDGACSVRQTLACLIFQSMTARSLHLSMDVSLNTIVGGRGYRRTQESILNGGSSNILKERVAIIGNTGEE